jgi:hypothetical protein
MHDVAAGAEALHHIDRTLAARPRRDGHESAAAVRCLATFRDHYVERHRSQGGSRYRATLERVNAVISVAMAAEFPIGEVPWDELEKARGWLDEIVRGEPPQ